MPPPGRRNISDAKTLRALAHPLRMRMLHLIRQEGALTATQCAVLVDESVANCSYHLNLLARYDYIEPAEGGQGREKPWRLVHESHGWSKVGEDAETSLAGQAAGNALLEFAFTEIHKRFQESSVESDEWQEATGADDSSEYLTAAEVTAMRDEIRQIMRCYKERRNNPAARPQGARPVYFFLATTVAPPNTRDYL